MKKIIFILITALGLYAAESAYAENLKKETFAEILLPIISNSVSEEDIYIKDIKNPSSSILKAVSTGVISLDHEECFNPEEEVSEYEALKSLVKAWEIRMGKLEAPALGGYLEGYASLTDLEKNIVDKAVMLGIALESGKIERERLVDSATASVYVERILSSIGIMKNHGVQEVITSFRNEEGVTGIPYNKITFYATLNETPPYDDATLVMALYCNSKLIDVTHKNYTGLKNFDFAVMHASLEIPETEGDIRVKTFMFDGLNSIKPIYEYKLLR